MFIDGYLAGDHQLNKDVFGRGYSLTAISKTREANETSETNEKSSHEKESLNTSEDVCR